MTRKTIYFDNAATTFPKPEVVYQAADQYLRSAGSPGRGAYQMSLASAQTVFETRVAAAELLGIGDPSRLIFTPGATYSINYALFGFPWKSGDVVLVTALEHNAVMRPLRQLEKSHGIVIKRLPYGSKGIIDLHSFIGEMLKAHPRLCVFTHGSNVTGEMIDLRSVSAICGAHKVPLMVDAAQTAGRSLDKIDGSGVAIWCASGHKGLMGAPGVGLLYTAPGIELEPTIFGGTGSGSESFDMPTMYPDRFEPGTMPGPAIAALGAGVRWLRDNDMSKVIAREQFLAERFTTWATQSGCIQIAGNRLASAASACTSAVSFYVPGVSCDVVAGQLDTEFGIAVRAGLHCAAAAHEALGTSEYGLIRVSFSCFNTEAEMDKLTRALETIASRTPAMQ